MKKKVEPKVIRDLRWWYGERGDVEGYLRALELALIYEPKIKESVDGEIKRVGKEGRI